jgi:hypothetical protein
VAAGFDLFNTFCTNKRQGSVRKRRKSIITIIIFLFLRTSGSTMQNITKGNAQSTVKIGFIVKGRF